MAEGYTRVFGTLRAPAKKTAEASSVVPNGQFKVLKVVQGKLVSNINKTFRSASDGAVEFYVLRDCIAYLWAQAEGFDRNERSGTPFTIPDVSEIDLDDLVPATSTPTLPAASQAALLSEIAEREADVADLQEQIEGFSAGGEWGSVTGTLSDQTDLTTALGAKANESDLSELSGEVGDLSMALDSEVTTRTSQFGSLSSSISDALDSIETLDTGLDAEESARGAADTALTNALALKAPSASPALTGTPTAPTAALGTNTTQIASTAYVIAVRDAILNGAPGTLDTLLELANALGSDPNFATTITGLIGQKLAKTSNLSDLTDAAQARTNLGLGTAATKDAPASGNAAVGEVVKGSDTRLTDSRTPSAHASSHASAGSDPLTLAESQITNLVSDLAGKVPTSRTVNGHALSSDVTLDKSDVGLSAVVNADTTTTANVTDSTNKRFVTDAQQTVIGNTSGTNTGDETAARVGTLISGATGKTTPVDADSIGLSDSAASNALKKLTWANLKATVKTYFDTLYQATDATLTALAAHNTNGLLTQTAADTFTGRTLTAGSAKLSVTNGNGVSGNPTVDLGTVSASDVGLGSVVNTIQERVLNVYANSTGSANSGTGETDLQTYSLPAGTMSADGKLLRISVFGSYANNANLKSVKIYFGSTIISTVSSATSNTGNFQAVFFVARTGAATQFSWGRSGITNGSSENGNANPFTTPAETMANAITIKVTGQSNTASSDVLLKAFVVEILN